MNIDLVIELLSEAFFTVLLILLPILGAGLVIGVMISIFQAATSINDAALAFIPKILAAAVGLLVFGHFMISRIAGFTTWVYSQIAVITQ